MDFTNVPTPTLLKTWNNLKKGLDEVSKSLDNGSFHTVGPKGAAPPSQSGQITGMFEEAVWDELVRRKVFKEDKKRAQQANANSRRGNVRTRFN